MKILNIALIGSALMLSGAASAQEQTRAKQPSDANSYYGLYPNPSRVTPSTDNDAFDEYGTRGREGFGASPSAPEGPGNVDE